MDNRECIINAYTLPDIEIYGGDTAPWEVKLVKPDGTEFEVDTTPGFSAILTLTSLKTTSGIGNNAVASSPILTKEGTYQTASDGSNALIFDFAEEDTKNLRGKFTYQIEIRNDEHLRICQGELYVRQNINR